MSDIDSDGYGFGPGERGVGRLAADMREMGEYSVARAAAGWDRLTSEQRWREYEDARREAMRLVEASGRGEEWRRLERSLEGMTEGPEAMRSWREAHGEVGHRAERAASSAALALLVEDQLPFDQAELLLAAMAEALPWLLQRPGEEEAG